MIKKIGHIVLNFLREGAKESILRLLSISLFASTTWFLHDNVKLVAEKPELQKFILILYIICFGFKAIQKVVEKIPEMIGDKS